MTTTTGSIFLWCAKDTFVEFEETYGSHEWLKHIWSDSLASDQRGTTVHLRARVRNNTIEFPAVRRRGNNYFPTQQWITWDYLHKLNPLALKPPPSLAEFERLYAPSLTTAPSQPFKYAHQPLKKKMPMYSDLPDNDPPPSLLSRLSPTPNNLNPPQQQQHQQQSSETPSRRVRGGRRGQTPERMAPPHLGGERKEDGQAISIKGSAATPKQVAQSPPRSSTSKEPIPLLVPSKERDISTSRWATPSVASTSTSTPTKAKEMDQPVNASSSAAIGKIEAMLAQLKTGPAISHLSPTPHPPTTTKPLPPHLTPSSTSPPSSTPVVPPSVPTKTPIVTKQPALGGRSRWDFEGIAEDERLAKEAAEAQARCLVEKSKATEKVVAEIPTEVKEVESVDVHEKELEKEKKKPTERRARGSKATKLAAKRDTLPSLPTAGEKPTPPSPITSVPPPLSTPSESIPSGSPPKISDPKLSTSPTPLPPPIASSPPPAISRTSIPSTSEPPLPPPEPKHIDWADSDEIDELPALDDWLISSSPPSAVPTTNSSSPEFEHQPRPNQGRRRSSANSNSSKSGKPNPPHPISITKGERDPSTSKTTSPPTSPRGGAAGGGGRGGGAAGAGGGNSSRRRGGAGASGNLFAKLSGIGPTPGATPPRGGRGRGADRDQPAVSAAAGGREKW